MRPLDPSSYTPRAGSEPPRELLGGLPEPPVMMPFGSSAGEIRPTHPKGNPRRSRRRSSVGNIVAALEAEIRSRREGSLEPRMSRQGSEDRPLPSYIYGITGSHSTQGNNSINIPPVHVSRSSSSEGTASPLFSSKSVVRENNRPWMSKGSIYSTLSQFSSDEEGEAEPPARFDRVKDNNNNSLETFTHQNSSYSSNSGGIESRLVSQYSRPYDSETLVWKEHSQNGVDAKVEEKDNQPTTMSQAGSSSLFSQNMNSYWTKFKIKTFSNPTLSPNKEDAKVFSNSSLREVISTPDGLPRLTPVERSGRNSGDIREAVIENEVSVEKTITVKIQNDERRSKEATQSSVQSESKIAMEQDIREHVSYVTRFEEEWKEDEHVERKVESLCGTKSTYAVGREERQAMEDLFDELISKTEIKRDTTQSSLLTEDTFFNDLVKTDTGTITGLEDHASDVSSSTDDLHSIMSPTNKNPDNEVDTSDDKDPVSFKHVNVPPRHRRKSFSDLDAGTKLRNKRKRNRTIEVDSWQGTVCQYTQRTFLKQNKEKVLNEEETVKPVETASKAKNVEQDLEQGLEIIIDRLRNIETKLDELKTMETSHGKESEKVETVPVNQEKSPGLNDASETTYEEDSSMLHYAIHCQDEEPPEESQQGCESDSQGEEDEVTLKDEYNVDDDDENDSILSDKTELICADEDITRDDTDFADYQITSPVPSMNCSMAKHRSRNVEIMSLSSMEDECNGAAFTETEEELEEDDDCSRKRRIEELARQFLEDNPVRSQFDEMEERPSYINLSLDTVSERSEDDTDYDWKSRRESKKKSLPTRRTRSQSREKTLHRIKYCWRCHNTGHESFDCRIEPQPGSWCPRCLEASHWEDTCWVSDTEVFCNICSVPGHLPCVHQTNDFRQRKLVIETFGWLSFKEWFREAEFWSWWNVSGFTNVPLYKLMQHRPGVVAPN